MKKIIFISFVFWGMLFFLNSAFSQKLPSLAINLEINDPEAKFGDIVSRTERGTIRSIVPYDKNLFGVIGEKPIIVFGKEKDNVLPVIYMGEAKIRVSNINGEIKKGDFITSSENSGIGQKATKSGFVVGKSLEDFNEKEGLISAEINVQTIAIEKETLPQKEEFSPVNIFSKIINQLGKAEDLPETLRYIFAIFLAGSSFFAGFLSFIRALHKGIEATGRNPLAKTSIRFAMVLNLLGIIILTLAGLGLAFFVIIY